MRPDAIDLASTIIHGSPSDVASWPATVAITDITMAPGANGGLSFTFTPALPASWDYHMPGWGDPASGDPGNVLYTVWACALVQGQWHAAAFIQMWRHRPSTGASLPSNWNNWAYAPDRWGSELVNYRPKAGDRMAFFVTAGNARDARDATSVRERSNVVTFDLNTSESGTMHFPADAPPVVPPVVPAPPAAPEAEDPFVALNAKLDAINAKLDRRYVATVFGTKVTFIPS